MSLDYSGFISLLFIHIIVVDLFGSFLFCGHPFVLLPDASDERSPLEKWKSLADKEPIDSVTKVEAKDASRFSSGDFYIMKWQL